MVPTGISDLVRNSTALFDMNHCETLSLRPETGRTPRSNPATYTEFLPIREFLRSFPNLSSGIPQLAAQASTWRSVVAGHVKETENQRYPCSFCRILACQM